MLAVDIQPLRVMAANVLCPSLCPSLRPSLRPNPDAVNTDSENMSNIMTEASGIIEAMRVMVEAKGGGVRKRFSLDEKPESDNSSQGLLPRTQDGSKCRAHVQALLLVFSGMTR